MTNTVVYTEGLSLSAASYGLRSEESLSRDWGMVWLHLSRDPRMDPGSQYHISRIRGVDAVILLGHHRERGARRQGIR